MRKQKMHLAQFLCHSPTYHSLAMWRHPRTAEAGFYAARMWATLDHLTRGRAAWNVVTSLNHNQSANYGEERQSADERYDRAHEFIEVCRKLWDS